LSAFIHSNGLPVFTRITIIDTSQVSININESRKNPDPLKGETEDSGQRPVEIKPEEERQAGTPGILHFGVIKEGKPAKAPKDLFFGEAGKEGGEESLFPSLFLTSTLPWMS